jgi:tetratricopeptide (TPR) repeat protein
MGPKTVCAALLALLVQVSVAYAEPATPASPPQAKNDVASSAATGAAPAARSGASPASPAASATPSSEAMSNPTFRACIGMNGEAALKTCSAAIDSDEFSGSDLAILYTYRGTAEAQSDAKHAEQDYNKAIDLNPNLAVAFNGRGMLFYDRKDYDHALQDFNRSIALDATDAATFDNRGITYFDMNDFDHAKADFDHAIELDPKDLDAYWNRGDLYRAKGDKESAAADYRMALSLGPNDDDKKEIESSLNGLGSAAPAAPASTEHQGSAPAPAATPSPGGKAEPAPAATNGKGASAETPAAGDGTSANSSDSLKKKFETKLDGLGVTKKNHAPDSGTPAAPDDTISHDEISHGDGSASASNPDPDYQACRNDSGDEAIAACSQVIGSGKVGNPELALAYDRRGYMYWGKGDLGRAFDDTNKAIKLDSGFARAY